MLALPSTNPQATSSKPIKAQTITLDPTSNASKVSVRAIGNERIIAPVENTWDSFFMNGPQASEDFMPERASQPQDEREALE